MVFEDKTIDHRFEYVEKEIGQVEKFIWSFTILLQIRNFLGFCSVYILGRMSRQYYGIFDMGIS